MKENVIEGDLPRVMDGSDRGVLAALAVHIVLGLFGWASACFGNGESDGWAYHSDLVAAVAFVASSLSQHRSPHCLCRQPKGAFSHGALVWCIGLIAGALFLTGSLASAAVSTGASAAGRRASLLSIRGSSSRDARAEEARSSGGSAALGGLAACLGWARTARL